MSDNVMEYLSSLAPLKTMEEHGIITHSDFTKGESFLAKKYCIKKGSIYRANDLINSRNRAMYMLQETEVKTNGKDGKDNRKITEIRKEN